MKKRLPFDISFLLESVLAESPDKSHISMDDVARLKTQGASVVDSHVHWSHHDARPFFIAKDGTIIWANAHAMHGSIDRFFVELFERFPFNNDNKQNENIFARDCQLFKKDGGIFLKDHVIGSGVYFNKFDGDIRGMFQYLRKNKEYFSRLNIRGGPGVTTVEKSGRVWIEKNFISFWNSFNDVAENMNDIFEFMSGLGIEPKASMYEFIDTATIYSYRDVLEFLPSNDKKLEPDEVAKLQAAQHLDPKAKNQLAGDEYKNLHHKKAAKGFDYAAKADAARPVKEIIKLKNLLP
jgi:hypothetical protein